jgi:hypothetical protein
MIIKIFLFQFVNSYASFFYLAFVAEGLGLCPSGGCMSSLAINLAVIFGSRLVTGNLLELLIPYLSYQYKYRKEIAKHGERISRPEKELLLDRVRFCFFLFPVSKKICCFTVFCFFSTMECPLV